MLAVAVGHPLAGCCSRAAGLTDEGANAKAIKADEGQCAAGAASACRSASERLLRPPPGEPKEEDRGFDLLGKACDLGDVASCLDLVDKLEDRPARIQQRRSAAEKACSKGSAPGCSRLGNVEYESAPKDVAGKDVEPAVAAYRKGCTGGDPAGCDALWKVGQKFQTGTDVPKDPAKATKLFEDACTGGSLAGCASLGQRLMTVGGPKDAQRGVELVRKACDGGLPSTCLLLGLAYDRGRGVKKDEAAAAKLYENACQGGEALACFCLGHMRATGVAGPKDLATAARLYEKACKEGVQPSCNNLGVALYLGNGLPKDQDRGSELIIQAAREGLEEAIVNKSAIVAADLSRLGGGNYQPAMEIFSRAEIQLGQ